LPITLPETIVRRRCAALIPYARNARTHSDQQVAQIAASIREFGFTNPVLINEEDGIIAGHGRVLAAHLRPMKVCTGAKTDSSRMLATAFSFVTDGAHGARSREGSRKLASSVNTPKDGRRRAAGGRAHPCGTSCVKRVAVFGNAAAASPH
jgi:hypothetical protein